MLQFIKSLTKMGILVNTLDTQMYYEMFRNYRTWMNNYKNLLINILRV